MEDTGPRFEKGKIYRRREIHDKLGGNRQSGISILKDHKMILLFTSRRGQEYGYEDGWRGQFFIYCGEGQIGDMEFKRGNRAVRDHRIEGRELHLFESVGGGRVRYIGQFDCVGYEIGYGRDLRGDRRRIILFKLIPHDQYARTLERESTEVPEVETSDLVSLRELAYGRSSVEAPKSSRITSYYKRADLIKRYVLKRANEYCEYCGRRAPFLTKDLRPYLEVHHILSLSDGGPDDPRWVIALCPNCHRMAHYSKDAEKIREEMLKLVEMKERELGSS